MTIARRHSKGRAGQRRRHAVIAGALWVMSLALCVVSSAQAAARCDASAKANPTAYTRALHAVWQLPEYVAMEHAGVKLAAVEALDHQVLIHGRCYWEITTFADGPQSMQRMDTFYVDAAEKVTMADNFLNGNRMTIAAWHRQQAQLSASGPTSGL